jgi:hypothetical protein
VSDYRRRRRIPEPEPRGIPLLPLLLVVVFAGLLLGGLLAKFVGKPKVVVEASPMPLVTPVTTPSLAPTVAPSPSAIPKAQSSATLSPSPKPSTRPTANPTHAQTPAPKPTRSEAVVVITPPPRVSAAPVATDTLASQTVAETAPPVEPTPASVASDVAAADNDRASSVVRKYLEAVARGDQSTAAGYLTSGLPSETYMSPSAKIQNISSDKNSDGSYKVTADVTTPKGEYFETFRVENGPYGYQISDHYTIKVQ